MPQNDFWDRFKKRLVEVSNAAADFTEEQAIIGKLKFDILTLKRKIDHALHDIGSRTLEIARSSSPSDPLKDREVKDLIDLVGDVEMQIDRKKQDIEDVSDQFRRRKVSREQRASSASRPAPRPAEPVKPTKAAKPAKTAKPVRAKKAAAKKPAAKAVAAPEGQTEKRKPGRPKKTKPEGEGAS